MNTRIIFDIKDYERVYEIIIELGGESSDFETDDCVELGDDEEYVDNAIKALNKASIEFEIIR